MNAMASSIGGADDRNNTDITNDPEIMQLVSEHGGGATTDDETTHAREEDKMDIVSPENIAPDAEHQQSSTALNIQPSTTINTQPSTTTTIEPTIPTGSNGNETAPNSMPAPSLPHLNLGASILHTPTDGIDPNLASIRAAQRQMRERMLATRLAREDASRFGTSSAPASRASSVSAFLPGANDTGDDDEEKEHQRLVADWKRRKAEFEKRKKAKKTALHEEMEFLRDQRQEEGRVRRYNECKKRTQTERRRYNTSEDPTGLFVQGYSDDDDDGTPMDGIDTVNMTGDTDSSDDDMYRAVGNKRPKTINKKAARFANDDNDDAANLEDLISTFLGNKSSEKIKQEPSKPGPPKGKKVAKPRTKGVKAQTVKGGRVDKQKPLGHQLTNIGSLSTNNVIRDGQRNQSLGEQPTFQSTSRAKALQQLVSSSSVEQRKIERIDRDYVKASVKDFLGRQTIKQVPDIGNGESGWQLMGMKNALKHFQLLGSAFMRRRERGDEAPYGGLDADGMGLGKTVMMLANIADSLRYREDKDEPASTLIVCPAALISQWHSEIHKHLKLEALGRNRNRPATVLVHTRKGKVQMDNAENFIAKFDFVLTTYNEVRRSFPSSDSPPQFQSAEQKKKWWKEFVDENKGPLHKAQWGRIVLDEAQAIKNRRSTTSLACRWLQGKCRWALTGTPMPNRTDELYAYFRFLRVPNTGSYKVFCKNFIGKDDPDKADRLQVFLSRIMLRRTHNNLLFNQPLVKLPNPSEEVHWVDFNTLERGVYEIVRRRMIERINQFSEKNELQNNYRNVLVMLLRLRQLTGHILTVESTMRDLLVLEDHERLRELAEEAADPKMLPTRRAQLAKLRQVLEKQHKEYDPDAKKQTLEPRGAPMACPLDSNIDESMIELVSMIDPEGSTTSRQRASHESRQTENVETGSGKGYGLSYDFRLYLNSLRKSKELDELKRRQKCAVCDQKPVNPWVTSCFHAMCLDCLTFLQNEAARQEKERARCPECGDIFYNVNPLRDWELNCDDAEAVNHEGSDGDVGDADGTEGKRKRKRKVHKEPDWIDMPNTNLLPSSKTTAIKAQILNWLEQDPRQKIIVYTQFLDMIRILAKVCAMEQWGFGQYHGGMAIEARDEVVARFAKDPSTVILLASLKSGGVGLNLAMASRVIIVDPWWNYSVEEQAFCRVFRIGQLQNTYMTRFAVRNTVDEAMINMQERKEEEIDEVINDVKGRRDNRLPMIEMLRLFGETREDTLGRPFILVDNIAEATHVDPDSDEELLGDDP